MQLSRWLRMSDFRFSISVWLHEWAFPKWYGGSEARSDVKFLLEQLSKSSIILTGVLRYKVLTARKMRTDLGGLCKQFCGDLLFYFGRNAV